MPRILYPLAGYLLVVSSAGFWAGRALAIPPALELPKLVRVEEVGEFIVAESLRNGVDPELMLRLVGRESGFDPNARSATNDHGLFQINAYMLRVLHVSRPYDARQSTIAGVGWFANLMRQCGSEKRALRAYAEGRCR